jgi:hypothetical protein
MQLFSKIFSFHHISTVLYSIQCTNHVWVKTSKLKSIDKFNVQGNKVNTLICCLGGRVSYLELLFLTVLALPNASSTGFDCSQTN